MYVCMYVRMCVNLYTRGEPGTDWDINHPSQYDITKVYYNVIDHRRASSSSECSCTYVCMFVLYSGLLSLGANFPKFHK